MFFAFAAKAASEAATALETTSSEADTAIDAVVDKVEEVSDFWSRVFGWFVQNWPSFIFSALILIVGWIVVTFIVRLMRHTLKRTNAERSLATFLCSLTKFFLRFLVIILCLYPFGLNIGTVFAALGAAGIGLSLGLKETVSNFASGIQIIVTKPFVVGDYIAINNVEGTVEHVEVLYTSLKTLENHKVTIPNSTLTAGTTTNFSALGVRRATFNFTLRYGSNISKVRDVLMEIAANHPLVLKEPAAYFIINGQEADGIACSMRVYTKPENFWRVFWDINESISNARATNPDLDIPFNQLDVHICNDSEDKTIKTDSI